MHTKLSIRRHQQDRKNIWRLSYFHAFTSRLERESVSAQLDGGFQYMKYSKGLYYNGRDQPDHVLNYHQKLFLSAMQQYQSWMVEYKIGEVKTELIKQLWPGKRRIVLIAHGGSMIQANDGKKEGWVLEGECPSKKKDARRGLHQSNVICLTYSMGGLRVQVLQWNMARIMKDIG